MTSYAIPYGVIRFGNYPQKIFDGLSTNTMQAKQNAFTDRFGRIIAAGWQVIDGDNVLFVCATKVISQLQNHLEQYLRLTKVKIEKLDLHVYLSDANIESDFTLCMGGYYVVLAHKMISSNSPHDVFRLQHHIPLQGIDFNHEFILNVNYDFVSFDKGCFLGQESVVRVHHQSKPVKKLSVVNEIDAKNIKLTSCAVIDGVTKGFGFIPQIK